MSRHRPADTHRAPGTAVSDGAGDGGVRVTETHISILFFLGDRVYKLRKPVRFGFLDFSSREAREADCQREVLLNRRLSPDVYLGVADVVMDGAPVDHMVVMRSLPQALQLERMVTGGADVTTQLDATARTLAAFHAGASRSPAIAASATPRAVRQKWTANFDEVRPFVGPVLDPAVDRDIRALVSRWLAAHTDLLNERVAKGFVCDGHGDLQASDVFCLPDGVRILDCLEFSDELRHDDVCGDVAFLAMDLERLGSAAAARQFVEAYERHAKERLPPALLHFDIALRAYVRAKVECLRFRQGTDGAAHSARALHALARQHLRRARTALVLVGGLPGTGKSTLASALGHETGWLVLRSDTIRRELPSHEPRYAPTALDAVYTEMLRRAEVELESDESVILDASWISGDQRERALALARQTGAEVLQVQCVCEDGVAASRIRNRLERLDDESEATETVRAAMASSMDPWPAAHRIDTTSATVSQCVDATFSTITASA